MTGVAPDRCAGRIVAKVPHPQSKISREPDGNHARHGLPTQKIAGDDTFTCSDKL